MYVWQMLKRISYELARKQHIRLLSSKQVPLVEKKKIINQKGGALLGLLFKPLIAPIIGSVLGEIIKK